MTFLKTALISILFITLLFFVSPTIENYFADSTNTSHISSFTDAEITTFKTQIQENTLPEFNEFSKFVQKIDIQIITKENFLFFSFLGIKENSTVLHNIYGIYNKDTDTIQTFPKITFQISDFKPENKTITLKNISKFAIPTDAYLMLLPQNIKIFSENNEQNMVLPNESITFIFKNSSNTLPPKNAIQRIESIKFGYKANVSQ